MNAMVAALVLAAPVMPTCSDFTGTAGSCVAPNGSFSQFYAPKNVMPADDPVAVPGSHKK